MVEEKAAACLRAANPDRGPVSRRKSNRLSGLLFCLFVFVLLCILVNTELLA